MDKVKEYRVRYELINGIRQYVIEQKFLWGLGWANIHIEPSTPDREFIDKEIERLKEEQICIIDTRLLDDE